MKKLSLIPATLCVVLALNVAAQTPYQIEMQHMEAADLVFAHDRAYKPVDVSTLTENDYYSTALFPTIANSSISLPDADLDPITRAVLLVEHLENKLPHTRYQIHYSINTSTEVPELKHDYLEINRYNLGPALREDLLLSIPKEHVADPHEFGLGPHVSWRFVMAPTMGMRADLLYASRKEIPSNEAVNTTCFNESCLSLQDPSGPTAHWISIPPPPLPPQPYTTKNAWGLSQPAAIAQELGAPLLHEMEDALPYTPDAPHFTFIISHNIAGQEASSAALAVQHIVLDDSIAEIWIKRDEIAQTEPIFTQLNLPR